MKKKLFLCLYLLMVLSACQPAANQSDKQHISQIKNDFASGLNVVLDYVSDGTRTFIICDVDNPQGRFIDLWLVQQNETMGQRTMSSRRFYTGNAELTQKTFRVQVARPGVTETVYVEVFNNNNELLMQTEPITNSIGGVQ